MPLSVETVIVRNSLEETIIDEVLTEIRLHDGTIS